jgi:glutathione synthase/RimK-type ligase-like ATP-grasp enzyme
MILLWGKASEGPLREVRAALAEAGADIYFFDQQRALGATLTLAANSADGGELSVDGAKLDLASVTAAYFRPYSATDALERVELLRRAEVAQRLDALDRGLWSWADVTRALVLNRSSLMASNSSKPLQTRLLAALGFEIPATLVTSDAEEARAFIASHDAVIYKSISATRSIVRRLERGREIEAKDLAACPAQFQSYAAGVDVRVHVVGERIFACEARSEADDYRYSEREGLSTRIEASELPAEIAERCRRASAALGLPLCGIDLRHTPDGRWVAFEVNPSPGFTFFSSETGAPIARAIAELLMRG